MNPHTTETVPCPACGTMNRVPTARLAAGPRPTCGECRAPLFDGEPLAIESAVAFDRHVQRGSLPVVVDFWADWCGPCRAMAPHFAAVARNLSPRVRLLKVDTEALPALAGRLAIRSLPSLVLFQGGREVARRAGLMPAAALQDWILAHLGGVQRHAS